MSEIESEKLTERERECLGHFKRAQELGVSFAEYCRSSNLKANTWHSVKLAMRRKGLLGEAPRSVVRRNTRRQSNFVAVRMIPAGGPAATGLSGAWCIRHPSGWAIECAQLPPVQWLRGLLGGEGA